MTKKIDIRDLTFLIPVCIDTIERLENIQLVIEFLVRNFETHIHILEANRFNNGILRKLMPEVVQLEFVEDFDTIFHRTYYINAMAGKTTTPYCAVWTSVAVT